MKKVRRLTARKETYLADKLHNERPKYKLDHLVRERFPHFDDAIRDLDDALTMIHLFSRLPSASKIGNTHPGLCAKLVREWQYYVADTKSLRLVFVSIKGVYYQAEVRGERCTWLVPHEFTHEVPSDVDLRVMTTFLEFYEVYFKFVMFKLFNDAGLAYPPHIVHEKEAAGLYLDALHVQSLAEKKNSDSMKEINGSTSLEVAIEKSSKTVAASELKLNSLAKKIATLEKSDEDEESEDEESEDEDDSEAEDDEEEGEEEGAAEEEEESLMIKTFGTSSKPSQESVSLFKDCKIFLSREVPRSSLEFVIKSFGGVVGWEGMGSPFSANDEVITHFICDRPMPKESLLEGREYVQPQWVYDSVNAALLLPVTRYIAGATLPPHLSPFIDDRKEGYIPKYREELDSLKSAVEVKDRSLVSIEDKEEEERVDEEAKEEAFERELEAEKAGITFNSSLAKKSEAVKEEKKKDLKRKKVSGEDEVEAMQTIMMTKKQKRLHGRMMYGIDKKEKAVEALKTKREVVEGKKKK